MTQLALYDQLYGSGVVAKQRVVDWMNGTLNQRWNKVSGTGTATPTDGISRGIVFTDNASSATDWNFNSKRQYDNVSSSILFTAKITASVSESECGFMNPINYTLGKDMAMGGQEGSTDATHYTIDTADHTTETVTAHLLSVDTNFHLFQLILGASSVQSYIDNSNLITKTSNLPTLNLEPHIICRERSGSPAIIEIKYLEAYNI